MMLVLIAGVSCVGKSTVIEILNRTYKFFVIPTYTTRSARDQESFKMHVGMDSFKEMSGRGSFFWTNEQFGHLYGTPKVEIEIALSKTDQYWVIDFPITQISSAFEGADYRCIVLRPDSVAQLELQIAKSKRADRREQILEDYFANYYDKPLPGRYFEIINHQDSPEHTALEIYKIVTSSFC